MKSSSSQPAQRIRFQLALPAEQYLAFYQGQVKDVVVISEDNRHIKFPASAIRHLLRHDGIYGLFEIQFDENNKLIRVVQINT